MKKSLLTILAAGTLAFGGCSDSGVREYNEKTIQADERKERIEQGIPISVASAGETCISTLIQKDNGDYVLAYGKMTINQSFRNLANAEALIESEINDGDNEKMTATGEYDEDLNLKMSRLYVNGYEVKFDN